MPSCAIQPIPLSIVHQTSGRLRLHIPRLAQDPEFAAHLLRLTLALRMVTQARVNPQARSLIVHHAPHWPASLVCLELRQAVERAATLSLRGEPRSPTPLDLALSSGVLQGVGWVLLATGAYATMQAAIRFIAGRIHPFQIVFLSNLLGVALLLPALTPDTLRTEQLSTHGLRALLDAAASLLLFSGLSLVPLAQVNALGFTTPLFAIWGASLLLGETLRPQSWLSLGLGIIGTLVIVRPGLTGIGLGSLLVLGGSAAFAGVLLLLKVLSRTDSSLTSITYNALLLTPLTLVPALAVWTMPTWGELAVLILIAGLAIAGQACMANALEKADATSVLPADFAQLLWASGLGYLLFREVPDLWTWLGGLLIFAGVIYAAKAETVNSEFTEGMGDAVLADA